MIADFPKELAVTVRGLAKRRGYTLVVVMTLAVGIAVCAAVFTLVHSVLLRPLPFESPDHLALIPSLNKDAAGKLQDYGVNLSDFLDWRLRNRSFSSMAAMQPTEVAVTGNRDPEQVDAGIISANLFSTLGVRPERGRFFEEEEEVENSTVVILSHDFWKRRFGESDSVLNASLIVDGIGRRVIGVVPRGFFFAANADLWLPLNLRIPPSPRAPARNTAVVGRVRPGIPMEQASNEMKNIADQLAKEHPVNAGWGARAVPVREPYVREVRNILILLFVAVSFLLLVVCINVANLVLVRSLQRRSEVVLRLALGGNRKQLFRQAFIENLFLTVSAGALGILLAAILIKPMIALNPIVGTSPAGNRILNSVAMDTRVFLFVLAVSILTGCVLSILPFFQISNSNLFDALKSDGKRTAGERSERKFQRVFVVLQLAISFLLMIGAGFMVQNFLRLKSIDPGFRYDHMVTARISLPALRYKTHQERAEFQRQVIETAETIPGVVSASTTTRLPLNEFAMTTFFEVDGIQAPEGGFVANFRRIGPGYFQTLRAKMVEGREFGTVDADTSMPVIVISREMANRFWKNQSALGKRIRRVSKTDSSWRTIVGVVDDVKDSSISAPADLTLYTPYSQGSIASFHLVVRTSTEPGHIVDSLRHKVLEIDKDLPLFQIATAEQLFMDSLSRPKFAAYLFAGFAILGLFIAIIGVYGVVSYSTARRVNEIGIRMAVGARQRSILALILQESARLSVCGILIGVFLCLVAERAISFWTGNAGWAMYICTAILLTIVAMIASLIPAIRATRIHPSIALRYE